MSDRHSISVIDFYQQFHCLGASCPKTCCFGWVILVDDDSHAARKREKGLYGLILRIFLKPRKDSFPCIRLLMGHCPHHIHGLCQMQVRGRPDLMPMICRTYPRRNIDFGPDTEITLELSCVEAARVFLENADHRLQFVPVLSGKKPEAGQLDGIEDVLSHQDVNRLAVDSTDDLKLTEYETIWKQENEDPSFLSFLRRSREEMLDLLWERDASQVVEVEDILFDYVRRIHRLIVRDHIPEAMEEKILVPLDEAEKRDYHGGPDVKPDRALFFPISILNDVIYNQVPFWEEALKDLDFFRLLVLYRRKIGRLEEDKADKIIQSWYEEMVRENPDIEKKYRAYLSYCMQEMWCNAYEDYHVLRQFIYAAVCLDLLKICDILASKSLRITKSGMYTKKDKGRSGEASQRCDGNLNKGNRFSIAEEVRVLSASERGFRHSIYIRDSFLDLIRRKILT